MKVINLFGEPCSGKSTTASGLFFLMKSNGINCEIINEYAKQLTWSERHIAFSDQLYVSAKQNHRLHVLKNKIDFAVCDSPLLLGALYAPNGYYSFYQPLIFEIFHSYNNLNFFLERVKPFNPIGRNQTEEESDALGIKLKQMLISSNIPLSYIKADKFAPETIFQKILKIDGQKKS